MSEKQKLLVATGNPGKLREVSSILQGMPFDVLSLKDLGISMEVEETGTTFVDNAILKAEAYCAAAGVLTLADDSGLVVDALGGRPGVLSARYGGAGLNDEQRVELLLREMVDVPWEERTARFRCVIALAWPEGRLETVEGTVEGIIQYEPEGANGFGYDPVFHLPEWGCTMAQLSTPDKNRISHRGQAVRKAAKLLMELSVAAS
jgi:XTP/dITP diphosphohydrolase